MHQLISSSGNHSWAWKMEVLVSLHSSVHGLLLPVVYSAFWTPCAAKVPESTEQKTIHTVSRDIKAKLPLLMSPSTLREQLAPAEGTLWTDTEFCVSSLSWCFRWMLHIYKSFGDPAPCRLHELWAYQCQRGQSAIPEVEFGKCFWVIIRAVWHTWSV